MTNLSDEEKAKIAEEERFRAEARRKVEKKKTSPAAWGCLTLLILGVVIAIASGSSGGDNKKSTTTPTDTSPTKSTVLSVGEEGIINNNDDPSDCHGGTLVASSKESFNALLDASVANDKAGLNELVAAGRVYLADNCSKVLVLDYDGLLAAVAKLRFTDPESPLYNQVGFVDAEFVGKE